MKAVRASSALRSLSLWKTSNACRVRPERYVSAPRTNQASRSLGLAWRWVSSLASCLAKSTGSPKIAWMSGGVGQPGAIGGDGHGIAEVIGGGRILAPGDRDLGQVDVRRFGEVGSALAASLYFSSARLMFRPRNERSPISVSSLDRAGLAALGRVGAGIANCWRWRASPGSGIAAEVQPPPVEALRLKAGDANAIPNPTRGAE